MCGVSTLLCRNMTLIRKLVRPLSLSPCQSHVSIPSPLSVSIMEVDRGVFARESLGSSVRLCGCVAASRKDIQRNLLVCVPSLSQGFTVCYTVSPSLRAGPDPRLITAAGSRALGQEPKGRWFESSSRLAEIAERDT